MGKGALTCACLSSEVIGGATIKARGAELSWYSDARMLGAGECAWATVDEPKDAENGIRTRHKRMKCRCPISGIPLRDTRTVACVNSAGQRPSRDDLRAESSFRVLAAGVLPISHL